MGIGLAWPLLRRGDWVRAARMTGAALAVFGVEYSFYGLAALRSAMAGLKWVIMPSPWRLVQLLGQAAGARPGAMTTVIGVLWPAALVVGARFIYPRVPPPPPPEILAPLAPTVSSGLAAPP